MRKVSPRQYAESLYQVLAENKTINQSEILDNFIALVFKNKDGKLLAKIITIFSSIYNEREGLIDIEIESARKVNKNVIKDISDWLKVKAQVKEIKIKEKINPSLLGGFKLTYNNIVVDAGLKTQLKNLQKILAE